MSAAVLAREGYVVTLANMLDSFPVYVRLYTNDPDLSADTVRADFVESPVSAAAPQVADRWTPPALRGGIAFAVADPIYFVVDGPPWPAAIRGYFATAGRDGPLLWAWRRPTDTFQFGVANTVLTIYVKATFPPAAA